MTRSFDQEVEPRLLVKVGPFCRKGLSPPGEPWCRHVLRIGKGCLR
jgi:hypothetical protein